MTNYANRGRASIKGTTRQGKFWAYVAKPSAGTKEGRLILQEYIRDQAGERGNRIGPGNLSAGEKGAVNFACTVERGKKDERPGPKRAAADIFKQD